MFAASDTSAVSQSFQAPTQGQLASNSLSRVGLSVLGAASGLLVWGTGFGGRSFGPVRFLLVTTPHGDKVGHFVLYGAIVFALAILTRRPFPAVTGALVMFAIGVADEFRQLWVGGRNFDLLDIAANFAGIAAGLIAAGVVLGLVETKTPTRQVEGSLLQR